MAFEILLGSIAAYYFLIIWRIGFELWTGLANKD
jgi:hypothetical protein